jgi:hypothetical protein
MVGMEVGWGYDPRSPIIAESAGGLYLLEWMVMVVVVVTAIMIMTTHLRLT